jgi:hypothetical protein
MSEEQKLPGYDDKKYGPEEPATPTQEPVEEKKIKNLNLMKNAIKEWSNFTIKFLNDMEEFVKAIKNKVASFPERNKYRNLLEEYIKPFETLSGLSSDIKDLFILDENFESEQDLLAKINTIKSVLVSKNFPNLLMAMGECSYYQSEFDNLLETMCREKQLSDEDRNRFRFYASRPAVISAKFGLHLEGTIEKQLSKDEANGIKDLRTNYLEAVVRRSDESVKKKEEGNEKFFENFFGFKSEKISKLFANNRLGLTTFKTDGEKEKFKNRFFEMRSKPSKENQGFLNKNAVLSFSLEEARQIKEELIFHELFKSISVTLFNAFASLPQDERGARLKPQKRKDSTIEAVYRVFLNTLMNPIMDNNLLQKSLQKNFGVTLSEKQLSTVVAEAKKNRHLVLQEQFLANKLTSDPLFVKILRKNGDLLARYLNLYQSAKQPEETEGRNSGWLQKIKNLFTSRKQREWIHKKGNLLTQLKRKASAPGNHSEPDFSSIDVDSIKQRGRSVSLISDSKMLVVILKMVDVDGFKVKDAKFDENEEGFAVEGEMPDNKDYQATYQFNKAKNQVALGIKRKGEVISPEKMTIKQLTPLLKMVVNQAKEGKYTYLNLAPMLKGLKPKVQQQVSTFTKGLLADSNITLIGIPSLRKGYPPRRHSI